MERSLRAARLATFAYFVLNGFVLGMWIVHIPAVEQRAGIGHALLGWLLLLLGAGAFAGMQLAGPLADRLGARRVVPVSAVLCGAALVLPGLAAGPWGLGAALLLFGFGNGCLDVAMNTHAVQVERAYRRPVMSAFHAVFSVGGAIAAVVGAWTLGRGWSPAATLAGAALLAVLGALLAAPALLPPAPGRAAPATEGASSPGRAARRRTPARIWALAGLALMLMLCEGVANDWSVLDLRDVLGASAGTAALAYGAFATAMTVGRLLGDRVAARFGPVAIVRYGSALAAAGLTAVVLAPAVPVALAGWTVFGIGLSGCIPQLFSAAGHADADSAGANVSRVAGLGYLGMLAGPAVIGPLTGFVPLNVAFVLPVAFCVVAACSARILRPVDGPGALDGPAPADGPGAPGEPVGPGPEAGRRDGEREARAGVPATGRP
ncbi:MFS transporter [Kitasatospora sp. NPDC057015]|uniref:MFS transporter n=1 Tax=Kitasatospora sp. NPDC057015 TaxID=3346001 RepID=UPI003634E084